MTKALGNESMDLRGRGDHVVSVSRYENEDDEEHVYGHGDQLGSADQVSFNNPKNSITRTRLIDLC